MTIVRRYKKRVSVFQLPSKDTDLLPVKEPLLRPRSPGKNRRKVAVMLEQSAMMDECDFSEGAENEIEEKLVMRVHISELQTEEKRMQYKNIRINAGESVIIR